MAKRFNTTGVCIPKKHYMVDINSKLDQIEKLIEEEFYFVINKPRQYGKTTTLNELYKRLNSKYIVIKLSFEGLKDSVFENDSAFQKEIIKLMKIQLKNHQDLLAKVNSIDLDLREIITTITSENQVLLMIDEVDKASNNKTLINFLGLLRALYLERDMGFETTFKSVILAGVHDIRNLKLKFRDGSDTRYNSPWNIAINFHVDMSFSECDIETMLKEYQVENNLDLDINLLSKEIYKFTSGYPYLVSRVCQIIDEDLLGQYKREWTVSDIQKAIKLLLEEKNTLFDDLIKNLENKSELYELVYNILINGLPITYNINSPIIDLGHMFGYLMKDKDNNSVVSNKILKEVIYSYMISKTDIRTMSKYNFKGNFITNENGLDMEKILLRFQQFMKENYLSKDVEFLERQGVLLFLSFIKPIINGVGFDYKEVQISEERRLDIVIQYNQHKYVIETKIWHGDIAHKRGLEQLKNYLDIESLDKGYLLIFNFNKNKEYVNGMYNIEGKKIFEVTV